MSEADVSGFFLFVLYCHSDLNVSADKQLKMCDSTALFLEACHLYKM